MLEEAIRSACRSLSPRITRLLSRRAPGDSSRAHERNVIGAKPTYDYFKQMQNRILTFIASHSKAGEERLEELMMNTGMLTKDLGTILVGEEAVREGLIDAVGGIDAAFLKLHAMIDAAKGKNY